MENEKSKLERARDIIDRVDREMAALFIQRMEAAHLVAEYKREHGLPVLDAAREEAVIRRNAEYLMDADEAVRDCYVGFLRETMAVSRHYQTRLMSGMRIAFCGTEGAFAHIAAGKIFPSAERVAFSSFSDAYDAVVSGDCDAVVLPLENSSAGEVGQVSDLIFSGSLYVNGTYDLAVKHDLLILPEANLDDVREVYSHPQALNQCAPFIKANRLIEHEYVNTALAAEYVAKKGDPTVAAIASEQAAELYGLKVAVSGINETSNNTTRFGVLSRSRRRMTEGRGMDMRFILMFTVRHEAGSLAKAIEIIGKYGYNMQALRSRPMKELLWQYYFYVEAEGNVDTENGGAMMKELASCCDQLKLIGSFVK